MRVKYGRTFHLPFSLGRTFDDKVLKSVAHFEGEEVVVTTKKDGENCLSEDSILQTDQGLKTIRDICEAASPLSVLSWNHARQQEEYRAVTGVAIASECDDWYELETADGQLLRLTGQHQVWVENEQCYKRVCALTGAEELRLSGGPR